MRLAKKRKRKWLRALAVVIGLLAAALAVPFLVPLEGYIPELNRLVSEEIGQPVSIRDLRLQLLPTPRVAVVGLRLGRNDEVSIERGSIVPDLLLLLAGEYVVHEVRAYGVRVKASALDLLDKLPKGHGSGILVRRVVLRHVTYEQRALTLPQFNVVVELSVVPSATVVRFSTDDGAFRATLAPQGGGRTRLTVAAHNWRLPFAVAPLVFDTLDARGELRGEHLDFPQVYGKLYGGTLSGSVDTRWGRGWSIGGKANIAGVQMIPLQTALGRPARLSGRLSGQVTYSAQASKAAQLGSALVLDAPFEVAGGEWHGVDLSRVAELPLGKLSTGGSTKYEQMKGQLALRGRQIQLNNLCLRSPSLTASGNVVIAPDQALSGKLDVAVAKTGGLVGVPVALAGTTADPSLSLTAAGAIGALIGTVLLPGIGTSLGLQAGGRLEGTVECK